MVFEHIVGVFIIMNTCLQIGWFLWSYNIHKRKHFTDEKEQEWQ